MVYGAESGLFPHVTASWLHHAGVSQLFPEVKSKKNEKWQSLFPRKYVNSGTFLGRAKEVSSLSSLPPLSSPPHDFVDRQKNS
jgi:hypothetical protein